MNGEQTEGKKERCELSQFVLTHRDAHVGERCQTTERGEKKIVPGKRGREEEEFCGRKKEVSSFIMLTYSQIKHFLATFLVNIASVFKK